MGVYFVILFFAYIFSCGYADQSGESVCTVYCKTSCDGVKYDDNPNFGEQCKKIQQDCGCYKPPSYNNNRGDPLPAIIFTSVFCAIFVISIVGSVIRHKFWRRNLPPGGGCCGGFDCSLANWTHSSSTAPVMHAPITAHPVTTVSSQFNTQYTNYPSAFQTN